MTTKTTRQTEDLVRALSLPATVRAADSNEDSDLDILHGQFARFDEWTEINSIWEGHFLERIRPVAFDRTIKENLHRVKVLYDHGHDPQMGNKPLGPIRSVGPTKTGMDYEVELIDTDYNRGFVIPAARAGLLGASFRMGVRGEEWVDPVEPADHNPLMLPERSITDIDLYEFGPVTFPAYEGATASMRSRSDEFLLRFLDPEVVAQFAERANPHVAAKILAHAKALSEGTDSASGQSTTNNIGRSAQSARLALLQLER